MIQDISAQFEPVEATEENVLTVRIITDMNPDDVVKKAMEMINRFDSE